MTDAKYIELLELRCGLLEMSNAMTANLLAEYDADPDGSKTRELAGLLGDALQAHQQHDRDNQLKATNTAAKKRSDDKARRIKLGNEAYAEVCRKHGIDQPTTSKLWKKAFDLYNTKVAGTEDQQKWRLATFKRTVGQPQRS